MNFILIRSGQNLQYLQIYTQYLNSNLTQQQLERLSFSRCRWILQPSFFKYLYSEDGKKQGEWSDLIQNYQEISNVYEIGKYENDLRQGIWNYKYLNELIYGGIYDQKGFKQGTWIDVSEQFWDQVTFEGQYKDGIKIGRWNINYREYNQKQFEIIGGGYFQNGFKNSKWIELSNQFWDQSQVICNGEYKNDLKVGLWDIYYRRNCGGTFQIIGQGSFDEQGQKNGYWFEQNFDFYRFGYLTQNGQYQNGKKIAQWLINYRRDHNEPQEIIGGGYYSKQGLKFGYWIDLSNQFYLYNQIIYQGEYRDGLKSGIWEIKHRRDNHNYFERIGGGAYDLQGRKDGEWIDLTDNFYSNITYCGKYQNGRRIGRWEIYYRNNIEEPNHLSGGGFYDEQGFKNNKWVDLSDNFPLQVTYDGKYRNGKKIGIWNTNYSRTKGEPNELIGGGQYDDLMQRNGRWIELGMNFWEYCQVLYDGIYDHGLKLGRWNINYRENGQIIFSNIGGGMYKPNGVKDGEWIEISDNFQEDHQVIYIGEYHDGLKLGKWNILYRINCGKPFKQIGGGYYDQSGLKRGKWIVLSQNFQENFQIIYQGQFIEDQKIGLWDTIFRRIEMTYFELIEYGIYDQNGQKNGKWVEMNSNFYEDNQVICIGEYQNDKKIGKWVMMERNNTKINDGFEKISEQLYY